MIDKRGTTVSAESLGERILSATLRTAVSELRPTIAAKALVVGIVSVTA